ncbi:MAG TPA: glycosyltransferase family 4 protein [Candidatus Polarisedimenticolia bacterium]|nr:glycosyltransferase family 4 protein [Candidatus Polarisedimenticolia bacterium]
MNDPAISYVLVCHSYPPILGGSEIEAQRVSSELQKQGYKPLIVCAGGDPMPRQRDWVDPCGLRVRIYGSGPPRRKDVLYALGVAWTLFKERRNYDVAYFLMRGLHLATGIPVAGLIGKPIVVKFSCSGVVVGLRDSWIGRLELSFIKKWAKKILVLNPGMAEEAREVGIDMARLGWMPNPVDTDYFRPASAEERSAYRRELNIGQDTPLAVFVGRLDQQKKIPLMLGGFAKYACRRPDAMLAILGDGVLGDEVRALATSLGLQKNVYFGGRVPAAGVLKWNQVADTCLLVSEVEGLPCSLIESMSVGVPPVVSRIPAHTQLIEDGVHGILTEYGNEESIAEGMHRVLDDHTLRDQMSVAARQRMIDEYSTERVLDCYDKLFRELAPAVRNKP